LVRVSGVGPNHLVLDLGAGYGALTAALIRVGARVIAVERDPRGVARLRRRFAQCARISVVEADLLGVPLPRRDFAVVANIPFSTTSALVHRLLDPVEPRLSTAALIVADGAAMKLAATARSGRGAWWGARFDIRRRGRVPRTAFSPPPSVDAAIVTIQRVDLPAGAEDRLRRMLRCAGQQPDRTLRRVLGGVLGPGQLRGLGVDPARPAGQASAADWRAIISRV